MSQYYYYQPKVNDEIRCRHCNGYFKPARTDTSFCSGRCRVAGHRKTKASTRHKGLHPTEVKQIPLAVAGPFIKRWHYSGKVPTGGNIYFGWYRDGELYGVANFGRGVNNHQATYLARETDRPVNNANLVELKRLCRSEPPRNDMPMTHFISRCHKLVKLAGYRYVVSFQFVEPT